MSSPATTQLSPHQAGSLAVFTGGIIVGLTSLFTRLSESNDAFDLQLLRTVPFALVLLVALLFARKSPFAIPTRRELLLGCGLVGCFYGFMLGVTNTSIPRAIFALTTYPLWAAILGRVVLGERLNRVTLIALVLAIAGLGVMTSSGLFGEPLVARDLIGMGFALMGGFSCGAMLVIIRLPEDRFPGEVARGYLLGAVLVCVLALLIGGVPQASGYDYMIGALHGFIGLGLSFFLIAWGAKRIPSARAGMFLAMEVVSGPALVWFFLGEREANIVYIGGALVFAAILLQALGGGEPEA